MTGDNSVQANWNATDEGSVVYLKLSCPHPLPLKKLMIVQRTELLILQCYRYVSIVQEGVLPLTTQKTAKWYFLANRAIRCYARIICKWGGPQ